RGQRRGDPAVAGWCIRVADGPRASIGMSAGACQGSTQLIHHQPLVDRYQRHAYTIKPRLVNIERVIRSSPLAGLCYDTPSVSSGPYTFGWTQRDEQLLENLR